MTFLWHAALYTCEVYGAMTLTGTFLLLALVCLKACQARKRQRALVVAGAEELLKDAAGGAR